MESAVGIKAVFMYVGFTLFFVLMLVIGLPNNKQLIDCRLASDFTGLSSSEEEHLNHCRYWISEEFFLQGVELLGYYLALSRKAADSLC